MEDEIEHRQRHDVGGDEGHGRGAGKVEEALPDHRKDRDYKALEVDAAGEADSYEGEYYFEDGQLCVDGDFFDYSLTEDTLILDTEEALEEETAFLFPMELTRV
jgi:hypothetical protein